MKFGPLLERVLIYSVFIITMDLFMITQSSIIFVFGFAFGFIYGRVTYQHPLGPYAEVLLNFFRLHVVYRQEALNLSSMAQAIGIPIAFTSPDALVKIGAACSVVGSMAAARVWSHRGGRALR